MLAILLNQLNSHDLATFLCMVHICLDYWLADKICRMYYYIIYDRVREVFGSIRMPFLVNLKYTSTSWLTSALYFNMVLNVGMDFLGVK